MGFYNDLTPPGEVCATTTLVPPIVRLDVTKTLLSARCVAGQDVQTKVVFKNNSTIAVLNLQALISDLIPGDVISRTWTAISSAGVVGMPASGTGAITAACTMPIGATITVTVTDRLDVNAVGSTYENIARIEPDTMYQDTRGPQTATAGGPIVAAEVDITLTKTGPNTHLTGNPGGFVHVLTVINKGPYPITGLALEDPIPTYAGVACSWTSTGSGGATGNTAAGNGSIAETLNMPVNSRVTYTLTFTSIVGTTPDGDFKNVATVTLPTGYADPTPAVAEKTTQIIGPRADVGLTKTGPASVIAGQPITWVLKVTNTGPQPISSLILEDPIPADQGILSWAYTSTGSGGSTGNSPSGANAISDILNIPVAGVITYTIVAQTDQTYSGSCVNSATVTMPQGITDPTPITSPVTHTVNLTPPTCDIKVQKTASKTLVYPGDPLTFTITILNRGPQRVPALQIADALPIGFNAMAWTATYAGGGLGALNGTGAISENVDLPANAQVRYNVTGLAGPTTEPRTIENTVTATLPLGFVDPNGGLTASVNVEHQPPYADITASKEADVTSVYPFGTVKWLLKVKNNGILPLVGYKIEDLLNSAVVLKRDWTVTTTLGATTPAASGTGGFSHNCNLPVNGEITYSITEQIKPTATPGSYANTATLTLPPGIVDPTPVPSVGATVQILEAVPLPCTQLKFVIRDMCCDAATVANPGNYMTVQMVTPGNQPQYDPLTKPPALVNCGATSTSMFQLDPANPGAMFSVTCPLTPNGGFVVPDSYYVVRPFINGQQCGGPNGFKVRIPFGAPGIIDVLEYIIP